MDPTKAFRVTIKMGSYMAKDDSGRIEYITARSIRKVVDKEECSLLTIVDYLRDEFRWGSKQYLSCFFWDKCATELAAINSDAELIEAFEMYFVERAIQLNMFVQDIGPKWSGKLMLGMTMEAVMMSQNTWGRSKRFVLKP